LAGYFLYDSEHQFHRYIGDDLNFNPLLAMIATFCLWALQERITGICVPVEFLARTHRADYDRYALLLAGMSAMELTALTQVLTNGSALNPSATWSISMILTPFIFPKNLVYIPYTVPMFQVFLGNRDFISKGSIVPRPVNELVHGIERTPEKRAHANCIAAQSVLAHLIDRFYVL
jgi:hypothetical protein